MTHVSLEVKCILNFKHQKATKCAANRTVPSKILTPNPKSQVGGTFGLRNSGSMELNVLLVEWLTTQNDATT